MQTSTPVSGTAVGRAVYVAFNFLPQLLFVLLAVGVYLGGLWVLLPFAFVQVMVPALDLLTDWQDDSHHEKEAFSAFELFLLKWNTRLYAIFYVGSVLAILLSIRHFSYLELGCLVASCGVMGAIGFAAAHELLHAKEKTDQLLQKVLTAFLFYPHYKLIHIRSHHVHAGTDHDENTAWLNEGIYSYILRTIPGSMVRCWQMEAGRSTTTSVFKNKMFHYAVGQVLLLTALTVAAGPLGLAFYLLQTVVAHVVLESVNYIQHYGLMRHQHDGEYEKTGAEHSWDSYHFFSSFVTFRVGHHSYHHVAVKPYYLLDTEPEAPKLPVGYFLAVIMVFVPPWWRSVMNPRLKGLDVGLEPQRAGATA